MDDPEGTERYGDFAISVRDCVERCLVDPVECWTVATDTYSWISPVDDSFHLEAVEVRGDREAPIVDVFFRWDGMPDRFGISYAINDENPAPDAYISVYVEEDLLALGRGVDNAHRISADGVTWLDWPGSSCLKH
jgi:hypothetical protein